MNETTNQTPTFNERCHFCPVVLYSAAQSHTPIRKPTKTYSRASLLNRIENAKKTAGNPVPEKKLGVDFKEKSIKKVLSPRKEVSEKEMDQVIKGLNSLGLEEPSFQDLSTAMEGMSLSQKASMQTSPAREKQKSRNKRFLIQMALMDGALRPKLPNGQQETGRFFFSAISVNKPKFGE